MANRIIECQVNDIYVEGAGAVLGAAGSHDDVVLRITFDDSWDGLNLWATFRDAIGENPCGVPIVSTKLLRGETRVYDVEVPAEVLRYSGKISLVLTGYATSAVYDDNGLLEYVKETEERHTAACYFRVLKSDVAMYDDGSVDVSFAQKLEAGINELHKMIRTLNETYATDEELVAGIKGAKGVSGTAVLESGAWTPGVINDKSAWLQTVLVGDVGKNDLISFSPSTMDSRSTMAKVGLFVVPSNLEVEGGETQVAFYADVEPTMDIKMVYFISRGQEKEEV